MERLGGNIFWFGCWNEPGHYIRAIGQSRAADDRRFEYMQEKDGIAKIAKIHIDGSLAPRWHKRGGIIWTTMAGHENQRRLEHTSEECPQGQFLRHEIVIAGGGPLCTALQWWDRTQGDSRGGSNSTILYGGKWTSAEVLEALRMFAPSRLERLRANGVELVEVQAVEVIP